MDFFIEIIFERIIVRFLGLHTRYLFFMSIGRKKSIKSLSGKVSNSQTSLSQDFFNALVGMIVILPLGIGIAYIVYLIFKEPNERFW